MIRLVKTILNRAWGWKVGRALPLSVGTGSQVRWWGVRSHQGGHLTIGSDCIINARIDFDGPEGRIAIGNRCFIGASHLVCRQELSIGDDVIISWGATIVDHDSHSVDWQQRKNDVRDWMVGEKDWAHIRVAPVQIQDKVWIGFGASILRGVTIGEGSVVGARAVVTKDVAPYTIVAGNPARPVKAIPHVNSL